MKSIEHGQAVGGCDGAKRLLHSTGLNSGLERPARYSVYASPPFFLSEPRILLARWLPLDHARAMAAKWSVEYTNRNPMVGFGRLMFGVELEMPSSSPVADGGAARGDILLIPTEEETRIPNVTRRFWLAGRVVDVGAKGEVASYSDRSGRHHSVPGKAVLVPAQQFSAERLRKVIEAKEAASIMFWDEYSTPGHFLHMAIPALDFPLPDTQPDQAFLDVITRYSTKSSH